MSLEKFIAALQSLELEPTAEELADVLWLTAQIHQAQPTTIEKVTSESFENFENLLAERESFQKPISDQTSLTQTPSTKKISSEYPSTQHQSFHTEATAPRPEARAPVYTQQKNTSHDLPLRTPAARYLPHSLQLARALRPLMQRVASRTQQQLNEVATVQRIAETQIWLPVIQGIPERRFDLMLIVEDSPSMKVWQPVIAEFQKLLENQGAFRQVHTWKMEECAGAVKLPHSQKELIDPTQRRLILVVSDCISAGWYTGKILELLTSWERHHPIALVQMLPQRMWRGTGLSQSLRVNFRATEANVLNSRLQDDAAEFWLEEDIPKGLKLPVITLESRSLGYWAKLMTGRGQDWVTGVIFESLQRVQENLPPPENLPVRQLSGEDRVNRFFATASPAAQQLARYLAIVPLTLEVMRLVQQVKLPNSEQVHLAEVFLGGLLKQATSILTEYDFHDGVRELLLQPMSESEKIQVIEEVSQFLSQRFGHCVDFRAWLKHPDLARSAECRPFAQVAVKLFRQLGGKYQALADQIEQIPPVDVKPPSSTKFIEEPFEFDVITVDKTGKEIKRVRGKNVQRVYDLGNGIQLELVYIPAGEFMMGSPYGEGYDDEHPQHKVVFAKPFYMGKYPVTQQQWQAVMGNNPSHFKDEKLPVERVNWNEAKEFCQKLSQRLGETFDLPSEAMWEYACRAGTTTKYCFGDVITPELANYGDSGIKQTTEVGKYPANAFGLYDMPGNVREWCEDVWHKSYNGAPSDGSAWMSGGNQNWHLLRGGSWLDDGLSLRCAYRFWFDAAGRNNNRGLRISRM